MTLDRFIFLILVFLYKLGSSTIKGHFHSTLVSNIILCTSLSSNRTIFFGFFRFLLDFLWIFFGRAFSDPTFESVTGSIHFCSLVSPFLLSGYIIHQDFTKNKS